MIAHDIFSRDVFFDITVEFQLKIPIKKKKKSTHGTQFEACPRFFSWRCFGEMQIGDGN